MSKVTLGPQMPITPLPVLLVGANVDDKPNFMSLTQTCTVNWEPMMVCIGMQSFKYTYKGIKKNQTFSINVPTVDVVKETDYCGHTTGAKVDKVKACQFKVFYGKLKTAPMVEQCPMNLECKVVNMLSLGSHELILGKVEETYISEECLTANGKPDRNKFDHLLSDITYYRYLGNIIGKTGSMAKRLQGGE